MRNKIKAPLGVIKQAAELTDSAIVSVSCGKDSLCVLDLCCEYFSRVEAFYMNIIPGLSFHERYLDYLERRYQIHIERRPHWALARMLREGVFRPIMRECPSITILDVEAAERERTGLLWIASGQKAADSLERRGYYKLVGGIDEKHHRICPIVWWNDKLVYSYLKKKKIPLPPDYKMFGSSYGGRLYGRELSIIKERYPDDFKKIERMFPHVGAQLARKQFFGSAQG